MTAVHRLGPPLPELARSATVTISDDDIWARLEVEDANGRTSGRDVTPDEARAYLASVDELVARVAAARQRQVVDAAADDARLPVRQRLQSELVSTCPHDGERRAHEGRVMLLTSPSPQGISVQHGIGWGTGAVTYEQYVCRTCGSVELFLPGALTHPAGPSS